MPKYAGSEYLTEIGIRDVSPIGREAADLLDDLFMGIYHVGARALHTNKWNDPRYIAVTIHGEFATFDTNKLTVLVVLCHDRCIRCEIEGLGPRYLRLSFTKRQRNGKQQWARHPTMEQALDEIRTHYGTPDEEQTQ